MLSSLLGLGNIASNLGSKLFGWLQARAESTANTDIAAINAGQQTSHDEMAWPETRYMVAATIFFAVVHFAAVVVDTVFLHCRCIPALPAPMDQWEGTILLAPFAAAGVLGVVKRIIGK